MNSGAGGTVSPATGYFNSGQSVQISALPNNGYRFNGWTGSGLGSFNGNTSPASVTLNGPITETGSFTQTEIQTNTGTNVSIQSGGNTITFAKVTSAGITTIVPINPSSAGNLPSGYQLSGSSIAYDISTTAAVQAPTTTCFNMSSVTDASAFSLLRVLHSENGNLIDRTTTTNFASKMICASVNSLSPFVVATTVVPQIQFNAVNYSGNEGNGSVTITVSRLGDTSSTVAVDYSTSDGTGKQRTDYTLSNGTVTFATGEMNKDITILLVDNAYVDGSRTVNLSLSNPSGVPLGTPAAVVLTILDNDTSQPTTNPLDNADERFFVREHYYDFLSRLPDQSGFDFWAGQIAQCESDQTCLRNKRIDVSNAFFYELEYQQTAAYVFRLYRAAFGNNQPFPNPDNSNQTEAKKIPSYAIFSNDRARLIGSANLTQDQLALANLFVSRPEFLSKYPASQTIDQFVDAVIAAIKGDDGVDLGSQRSPLIALGSRGAVLYRIADDNLQTNPINNHAFVDAEYNRSFVASQYFGYLRRDADISGFLFWLGQVGSASLRDVAKQHAMVCSFTTSAEYQQRFSPIVTHTNAECPH
jgi:hypothetical protein